VQPPSTRGSRSSPRRRRAPARPRPGRSPARDARSTRALVTRPTLASRRERPARPRAEATPGGSVKPTEGARARERAGAPTCRRSRPCRCLTIQGMPAPIRFDSESVSWPTITCAFSRRSTRCGSSPNGRAPPPTERVPEMLADARRAVQLVAELADEADAKRETTARRPPGSPFASRYLNASLETSASVSCAERLAAPAAREVHGRERAP
jgi:hypothetical protein